MPEIYSHRIVLRLDPGSAFGTGSHPTTRLCLEALDRQPPVGLRMADVGCGSGTQVVPLPLQQLPARSPKSVVMAQ